MVVAMSSPLRVGNGNKKRRAIGIPIIDLSERDGVSESIVKACEEYGFFKVVNHGIPSQIISRMEKQGLEFFKKEASEKKKAGPPTPFGYGVKSIGTHGDTGHLEYLLLESNPQHLAHRSPSISDSPFTFSCAVNDYMEAVKKVACELLNLVAQGLCLLDGNILSHLINHPQSDSCFRINYYPRVPEQPSSTPSIGFGEHSDPQMITVLRSNDVGGLQICTREGLWVTVPPGPNPNDLCVFVGDALQVMTNGRFEAVRHRVMANTRSTKARLSMVYFGAPSLNGWISPIPQMQPPQYKSFTWGEYKKAAYSLPLGQPRIDLFKLFPTPNKTQQSL